MNFRHIVNLVNILVIVFVIILAGFLFSSFKKDLLTDLDKDFVDSGEPVNVILFSNEERNDYYLLSDKEMVVSSSDLLLDFYIKISEENYKIKTIKLDDKYFDLTSSDDQFVNLHLEGDYIKISPLYLIDPTKHKLEISLRSSDNIHTYSFPFLVKYEDDFSNSENSNKLWREPVKSSYDYKDNFKWEIKDGNLIGVSYNNSQGHVSTPFLRRVKGDVNLEFNVHITSDTTSLVAYFLESEVNFIIGDGSNDSISYIQNGNRKARKFNLHKGEEYVAKIERTGLDYHFEIKSISDPSLFEFFDITVNDVADLDTIGFSIWHDSGGVEITSVSLWSE